MNTPITNQDIEVAAQLAAANVRIQGIDPASLATFVSERLSRYQGVLAGTTELRRLASRIARNRALNIARKRRREQVLVDAVHQDAPQSSGENEDREVLADAFEKSLADLTTQEISLCRMVYVDGVSIRRAAQILALPERYAYSHLETLRKRLSNRLQELAVIDSRLREVLSRYESPKGGSEGRG